MRRIAILLFCLLLGFGDFIVKAEEIRLVVGKTRIIECPPDLKSVNIDDPKVLDVTVDEDKLLFTGKNPGEAKVSLVSVDGQEELYKVIVWEQDINKVAKKLRSTLRGLGIDKEFKVSVDQEEGLVYLTGTVYTEEDMSLIEQAISSCASDVIVNLVRKDYSMDSIRLHLNVMEVGSSLMKGLGITWPQEIRFTSYGSDVYDENGNGLTLSDNIRFNIWQRSDVQLLVKALESGSNGKVLARPNVLALNGEKAEITIGGEVPIITSDNGNVSVDYRSYGVILKMKPTIIRDGIKMEVECEVSDIDPNTTTNVSIANDVSNAIYNVPGFLVRRAKTILSIKNGGTLIIGGLMKNKKGVSYTGIPGLVKLPILGEFFKSKDTQNEDMELIITITPEIVPLKEKGREGGNREEQIGNENLSQQTFFSEESSMNPQNVEEYKDYVSQKIAKVIKKYSFSGKNFSSGKVFLSLRLDRDGRVTKISFQRLEGENKQVLRRMALNIIRDAQPFLPLPEELAFLWIDVPIVFEK